MGFTQVVAHEASAARQPHLDRARRQVEDLRDAADGQVLEIEKVENGPVCLRDSGQGAENGVLLIGGKVKVVWGEVGGVTGGEGDNPRTPGAGRQAPGAVEGRCDEPRLEVFLAPALGLLAVVREEDILEDIVGVTTATGMCQGDGVDHRLVALDDGLSVTGRTQALGRI
jgi:hypothetical protein